MKGYNKASIGQTLEIERLLNEHFDSATGRYRVAWDDASVAEAVTETTKRTLGAGAVASHRHRTGRKLAPKPPKRAAGPVERVVRRLCQQLGVSFDELARVEGAERKAGRNGPDPERQQTLLG